MMPVSKPVSFSAGVSYAFDYPLGSGYQLKRKDADGKILEWKPERGVLRLQMLPCSYLDLELKASQMFLQATKRLQDKGVSNA